MFVLRLVWMVLQVGLVSVTGFVLAAALGAQRPTAVVVGVALGVLAVAGWVWQRRAAAQGRTSVAWRAALGFTVAALALLLLAGGLVGWQLYSLGSFPPLSQDRAANFDRLWAAMDKAYPYFAEKDVAWEAVGARYRPQAAAAVSDEAYAAVIEAMLAELDDAHTHVSGAYAPSCTFGSVREIEGQAVVIRAGEAGAEVGLAPGAVVTAVGGQPTAQRIADILATQEPASTPWQARYWAFGGLLRVPQGETLSLTFATAAGESREAALTCTPERAAVGGDIVSSERLPNGIGVIRIAIFSGNSETLVQQFDAALDELMDAPGLILDLRGNGGGNANTGNRMIGRFFAEPVVYGYDSFPYARPQLFWSHTVPYDVAPRGPRYTGPVVVLTNEGVMSSAENVLVGLVDSGRAQTVGRTTGGASGFPVLFNVTDDLRVQFSTADFRRLDGTPIEGVGIAPDVPVTWTVDDVRQGRDPDVDAAVALLRGEIASK